MDFIFEKVKENIYVLAVWDAGWNSYNNCYFIVDKQAVTVIDSAKSIHTVFIEKALQRLGKTAEDVTLFLATHGHEDHVQAASLFKKAEKHIHINEKATIESPEPGQFIYDLPDEGRFGDFDCYLAGYHSPGSVVFYHRPTETLFTGDFLCFFGDPLSPEGLVSEGKELRNEWIKYLQDGGVSAKDLGPFLNGLETMAKFDASAMCSGHGGVLIGDITGFISELITVGRDQQVR